jgi:predicted Zn finger-like uncharacterized protein
MIVHCPRCRTRYRVPSRSRGAAETTYRCARCRHVFTATAEDARPPAPPPVAELEPQPDVDEDDRFRMGDDTDDAEPPPAPPEPAPPRTGTPARFALRAVLGVSLGYALLSVYLYTHPNVTSDLLSALPVVGEHLAETRLEPNSVQLADVRGSYERVQDDQLVFVITGTAINNAPVAVRAIQIQGRIVGAQEQRQVVFCGAAPRDVHELSAREIGLLQALEPPKEWALGPGEQSPFLVAFVGPPKDLKEFSAEVVAVRTPGRTTSTASRGPAGTLAVNP